MPIPPVGPWPVYSPRSRSPHSFPKSVSQTITQLAPYFNSSNATGAARRLELAEEWKSADQKLLDRTQITVDNSAYVELTSSVLITSYIHMISQLVLTICEYSLTTFTPQKSPTVICNIISI